MSASLSGLGPGAIAFASLGMLAMRKAAGEARRTKGTFDGSAAQLLSVAVAVCEAGRNAFQALAGDPSLPATERQAAMQIAGRFVDACGELHTRFGRSSVLLTTQALSVDARGGPASLGDVLAPPVGPVAVELAPAALVALDWLRQDPLALAEDLAGVRANLAAAVDGTRIT